MEMTLTDQKKFKYTRECSTTLSEFDRLFEELFNRTWVVKGKEYNLPALGWERGYNVRKRSLGLCSYRARKATRYGAAELLSPGTVWISKELLSLNLDKAYDFEDTIRHEIAHAIHAHVSGRSSHNSVWQSICREVGADDTRCHDGFLEQPKGKYTLVCGGCNNKTEKYRRPKNRKACGKCCNKHANGRFDTRFELQVIQNY